MILRNTSWHLINVDLLISSRTHRVQNQTNVNTPFSYLNPHTEWQIFISFLDTLLNLSKLRRKKLISTWSEWLNNDTWKKNFAGALQKCNDREQSHEVRCSFWWSDPGLDLLLAGEFHRTKKGSPTLKWLKKYVKSPLRITSNVVYQVQNIRSLESLCTT